MKKLLTVSVVFVSIFVYSNINASSYTVIDSFFQISGSLSLGPPDSYEDSFNENSSTPLIGNIGSIHSQASFEKVEVAGSAHLNGAAHAFASTEVLFKPNFIGGGDPITFTFYRVGYVHFPVASIEDLTTGETIFANSSANGNEALSYSGWNPDHTYELYMQASFDFISHDDGMLTVQNDMSFVVVPEPSALLLLGFGLFGFAAFRRKFKE